jgi:hypothetical protein
MAITILDNWFVSASREEAALDDYSLRAAVVFGWQRLLKAS